MSRVLIEVKAEGCSAGLIVPWLELDRMDWTEYLRPLAELVAAKHPEAEWSARPLAEEEDETEAVLR